MTASAQMGRDITQLANAMPAGSGLDEAQLVLLANDFSTAVSPVFLASITSGGVVPIFSSSTTIQPGCWISIFDDYLANNTATWNGDFPTSPGSTSVTINGKPEEDDVLQWRLHACDVLQSLGTARGRVFRYFNGPRANNNSDHVAEKI
jgi:hypothetical protein